MFQESSRIFQIYKPKVMYSYKKIVAVGTAVEPLSQTNSADDEYLKSTASA